MAVVGSGVIGLSTAVRLREAGCTVEVVAREFPPHTTSDVAAAFWSPYRVGPVDRAFDWADRTYREFEKLCDQPGVGVSRRTLIETYDEEIDDPWYARSVSNYQRCSSEDLPDAFTHGFQYDTFLFETPVYMPYLFKRCQDLGVSMKQADLTSLNELSSSYQAIVNCCGVGAYHLVDDQEVYPIRGQVVVANCPNAFPDTILAFTGKVPAYVVPRTGDCVLGGTAQVGNWDLKPDPDTAIDIRNRSEKLQPATKHLTKLGDKVGLRPGRDQIRLERDDTELDIPVIHNYGHGGGGFTLSWGCADEVVKLVG